MTTMAFVRANEFSKSFHECDHFVKSSFNAIKVSVVFPSIGLSSLLLQLLLFCSPLNTHTWEITRKTTKRIQVKEVFRSPRLSSTFQIVSIIIVVYHRVAYKISPSPRQVFTRSLQPLTPPFSAVCREPRNSLPLIHTKRNYFAVAFATQLNVRTKPLNVRRRQ